MVDYKPRQYTGHMVYAPRTKLDPRIRFYEPKNPINVFDVKPKTYIMKPLKYIQARTYDKFRTYDSYAEYVPPWSRGPKKEKRKRLPPREVTRKVKPAPSVKPSPTKAKTPKSTSSAPVETGPKLEATESIRRTMMLFNV